MSTVPLTVSGYLHPFEDVVFSCGSLECLENDPDRLSSKGMWTKVLSSTLIRLRPTRCDFCFIDEFHQSLCKTKNYCSSKCRNEDDLVHKVCCKEGRVEARKVKTGGKEKPVVANRNFDLFVTSFENQGHSCPETKKIISKLKKTKLKPDRTITDNSNRYSEVD